MRVVILESGIAVSERAADLICQCVQSCDSPVLGLATGGTPLATYAELIRRYESGKVSFSKCTTFNLDEYVGLPEGHAESYRVFMQENLFAKADFEMESCHLPDGNETDLAATCAAYEERISRSGGIDLQLLGIGSDGHIAFNEPGSSLASRTRPKALTEQTRLDNARFFNSPEEVPRLAITMGIGSILDARKILLLATGENKAAAVREMAEGPLSASCPASALQLHANATVLLDPAAASQLKRSEYYKHVEKIQQELEQNSFR
ncbi:MAG: glucosamine-6-phosphate deaminase [Planctomycetota bacterium]